MAKRRDDSDPKPHKIPAADEALQRAIRSSQITVPPTLRDTMRAYEEISRSVAGQVNLEHITKLTGSLNSSVAAAYKSLQTPSIGVIATQVLKRHERSVLEAIGKVSTLALQKNDVIAQAMKLQDALAPARALTDVMRQAQLVTDAHRRTIAALATPIKFTTAYDDVIRQAIQQAKLNVPDQPSAEELLAGRLFADDTPEVTLQAEVIELGDKTTEGQIVIAVSLPWFKIYAELEKNPQFLFQFVDDPRRFEEFIAGAYELAGWKVTLTPRSGDLGRDVIAEKPGLGSLRFLEQCKAYRPGHKVSANDVRAMLGVLSADLQANKALVTTTSEFAPGIETDTLLKPFLGNRLELKDGPALLHWLKTIVQSSQT